MYRYGPRFVGTPAARSRLDAVIAAVEKALAEAGIEFSFPNRTLSFGSDVLGIPRKP
jgi:hypothetical protein